jgi:hypothetical protein
MGDFDFVSRPDVDTIPAVLSFDNKEQESVNALEDLSEHLGGLLDTFRVVHPDLPAVTHLPASASTSNAGNGRTHSRTPHPQRRLDRIYFSPDLVLRMPALTDVQHIDRMKLATIDSNGKSNSSDHTGVTATLRFSGIVCPPPK